MFKKLVSKHDLKYAKIETITTNINILEACNFIIEEYNIDYYKYLIMNNDNIYPLLLIKFSISKILNIGIHDFLIYVID